MFQKEFDNAYYYNNEGDLRQLMYCKTKMHKSTLVVMITESP